MTMKALLILFTLFIAESSSTKDGMDCTPQHLQSCQAIFHPLIHGNNPPTTKEELIPFCSAVEKGEACIDEHVQNCFTEPQQKVYKKMVSGGRNFLGEICTEGKTQAVFLRSAPCYRNITVSEDKCAQPHRQFLQAVDNWKNEVNDNERFLVHELCCAFKNILKCKDTHIHKDCSEEAIEFFQHNRQFVINTLEQGRCEAYMYEEDVCASSAYTFQSSVILSMASFSSILMLIINLIRKDI